MNINDKSYNLVILKVGSLYSNNAQYLPIEQFV